MIHNAEFLTLMYAYTKEEQRSVNILKCISYLHKL